ncbi:MAG: methylmalonyl-CoA epimerase [Deltaproteobacteria bacterium]|nr:methylmalonyl-CoA epimerase [Deltaproteobacteria bacterium]
MRFSHLDHVGIAVEDFEAAVTRYTALHGVPPAHVTTVPSEQVQVAMFAVGPTKIELLAATDPQSPIARFIAKRGPGLHHIAYAVTDFDASVAALQAEGLTPIQRPTAFGAEGHRVAFFHPKETGGVLIEIVSANFSK